MKRQIMVAFAFCSLFANAQESAAIADTLVKTKDVQEIILKAQRKKMFADKAVYTFDSEALKEARYANDLLRTLPELRYDPIANAISSTKGGTVLFLINGIEATELQMRTIQPENVVRVEYFDNPPTRWANRADTVVNLITRNPETGYAVGADVSTAPTTGFVNGSAYGNYTRGRNNIGFEYYINLRDYDNRQVDGIYDYELNGSYYGSDEQKRDHFGYTYQSIAARYTNALTDNYAFQVKFNTEILDSFNRSNGVSIFTKDNESNHHTSNKKGSSNYIKPTLDLYFSKKLGKKDELSLNVVGTYFTTNTGEESNEWVTSTEESVFENTMNLRAQQKGLVGEIAHTHEFKAGKLSSGYRVSNSEIDNQLLNLEGFSQYKVNYLEQYVYTEFAGKKNKWMYRIGAGLTNIHNKSAENTENSWTFSPKLILGYQLAKNQSLRLSTSYAPSSPASNQLSSNVVQMVPNIVSKGNPYLESEKVWQNNLMYSINSKYFDINANAFYYDVDAVINQYFVQDPVYGYALTYENGQNGQKYGLELSGSVKPFGTNQLVIKAVVSPSKEIINTNRGAKVTNTIVDNYFVLSSQLKNWSFEYQFNIPVYQLSGAFLSKNENQNHFFAQYKLNNWSFSTGMYWIGTPSVYKTKSLSESLVNYTRNVNIMNNKSMVVLGVGYNFAKGKKTEIEKKLNNNTAGAATF